jgi:hypothetical protein
MASSALDSVRSGTYGLMANYREFWKPLVGFGVALTAATAAGLVNQVGLAVLVPAVGAAVCFSAALLLHRQ